MEFSFKGCCEDGERGDVDSLLKQSCESVANRHVFQEKSFFQVNTRLEEITQENCIPYFSSKTPFR